MTWDEVVAYALTRPGMALATSYGTPAVKLGKTMIARLRPDGDMVLHVGDGLREALIELQPQVFHTTPHYDGYPLLLVRLAPADADQIEGLIDSAVGSLVRTAP